MQLIKPLCEMVCMKREKETFDLDTKCCLENAMQPKESSTFGSKADETVAVSLS